jgi:8-oxo-dGTP diphosphatase
VVGACGWQPEHPRPGAEQAVPADRFAHEIVEFLKASPGALAAAERQALDGRLSQLVISTGLDPVGVTLALLFICQTQTSHDDEREVMMRSAVIILENDQVALIERVREGHTYYVFPGGTIEQGETAQAAAIREAYEELGVHVELQMLTAVVRFHNEDQQYYRATISAGQFGTGTGEEFSSDRRSARGSYRALWLARQNLTQYDVRPHALAQALGSGALSNIVLPLRIDEGS